MPLSKFSIKEELPLFSQEQSHAWITNSPICTKIIDLDFNLQYMSAAGIDSLGITDVTNYYGKPYPFSFYPKCFRDEMLTNIINARDSGKIIEQEAAVVDTDGNEVWFHSTISPLSESGDGIDHLMIVSIDTTKQNMARQELEQLNHELEAKVYKRTLELELANEQLFKQAETDFLTQLYNRHAFDRYVCENIASAKRNQQSLSLLMIDIDLFKHYNDLYGHDTGDIVLKKVAYAIDTSLLRKTDIAARYGGEEFAILLPETDIKAGLDIAEKIRANVEHLDVRYGQHGKMNHLTVSIGVAALKGDELNATDLLKYADKALYMAKNAGRNNCSIFIAGT